MNSSPVAKNPAGYERRLFQNIAINLVQSRIYSPLIDVLRIELYNIPMEESTVQTLVAFEIAQPARKRIRSAGALYLVLILLILAVISLANALQTRLTIPRVAVQLPLYALIAVACFFVYRKNLVSYRYTLTDRVFAIDRLTEGKEQTLAAIRLEEIELMLFGNQTAFEKLPVLDASVRARRTSARIVARLDGRRVALFFSPSEDFFQKLYAQWLATLGTECRDGSR